ncbi:hypothetical protein FSARC_1881 [Fusarium sarcochroum]|uniref:Methyltransferase domain-containing protein n=1 Tax=Fusarium sarcochroum TaxID=1208366 RepID=A0A8H4U832_9HYPO|nr:hypothetical protein FSARC_1881 [Fusarium sarcochroum]
MTVEFALDIHVTKELGFLRFAIGGSRAYSKLNSDPGSKNRQDWDFIAVVQSKDEIISIVTHHATQLNALLGIIHTEDARWDDLLEHKTQSDWEVLRFAGWAKDGSKRSLKICSYNHLHGMASRPDVCRFGVLSARVVRYCHRYHPKDGHRLFVYQPLRFTENLRVLEDADFLHPEGHPTALNPGVTCDLYLTSTTLYNSSCQVVDDLFAAFVAKWQRMSKAASAHDMKPLFYGNLQSGSSFHMHLQNKFSQLPEPPSSEAGHPAAVHLNEHTRNYRVFSFLSASQHFWSRRYPYPGLTNSARAYQGAIEFRQFSRQPRSSAFTSNSSGCLGQIRLPGIDWQNVFVKIGPQAEYEASALHAVQQYFPSSCVQQLLAQNTTAGKLFFKLHEGKTLHEIRLDLLNTRPPFSGMNLLDQANWFLEVELCRAEQVTDAYRTTLKMEPDSSCFRDQRIHRFFHERLQSDARFVDFYAETIQGICSGRAISVLDFMKIPLTINSESYLPLEHYLNQAREALDPQIVGGLEDLPVAFGLGDGHGGNLMVNPHGKPTDFMHIDYEISGFHCPFLDMAKVIYNDAFFNVLYGDLLSGSLSEVSNASGAVVNWKWSPEAILIDYNFDVDDISRITGTTKLQYILRPLLELVAQDDPSKAQVAEDVLGYALFSCALLTRNFSKRPDLFFLNLALGVRLASGMRAVFYDVFGWEMPEIAPHTCIRESIFAESRIDQHFAYKSIVESSNPKGVLVDVGCCMGTDLRKLISDGYPSHCLVGLDIETRFFTLGRALYNENENCSGPRFRQADMLQPKFGNKYGDLIQQFDAVHTSNVLHLFSREEQEVFFQNLILLTKPGGVIWGRQVGLAPKHPLDYRQPDGKGFRFTVAEFRQWCLRVAGWDPVSVNVEAELVEYDDLRTKREDKKWVLQWKIQVPK